jgi:hypothetical protein
MEENLPRVTAEIEDALEFMANLLSLFAEYYRGWCNGGGQVLAFTTRDAVTRCATKAR